MTPIDKANGELRKAIEDAVEHPDKAIEHMQFLGEAQRLNAKRGVVDLRSRRDSEPKEYRQ